MTSPVLGHLSTCGLRHGSAWIRLCDAPKVSNHIHSALNSQEQILYEYICQVSQRELNERGLR